MTSTLNNRELLRSRDSFAFGSSLELAYSTLGENIEQKTIEVLTNQVIIPYVAYGTVLLSDLNSIGDDSDERTLASDLVYARQKGLCKDLEEVFSEQELNDAYSRFYDDYDSSVLRFIEAFEQADIDNCASLAEFFNRKQYNGSDRKERSAALSQTALEILNSFSLLRHDHATIPPTMSRLFAELEELSDKALADRAKSTREKALLLHTERSRIKLVALGKQPTIVSSPRLSSDSGIDRIRLLELSIPGIALPRLQTTKDLIDFVMMDEYRAPMNRLRAHCTKLASDSKNIGEISEAIADDLMELDRSIKKEKLDRYFGTCKFIFGTVGGLIEDLVKGNWANIATRPFEIAEKISDQYYYGPQYKKEPLYFLWSLKDRFGG